MKKKIKFLKEVEREVYPVELQEMQDISSYDDLRDYCEGKPRMVLWDRGYILYTKREIVDFCSATPISLKDLMTLIKVLKSFYGRKKKISVDLRSSTSYRIFTFLQKRGRVKILKDRMWMWGSEEFHSVTFRWL